MEKLIIGAAVYVGLIGWILPFLAAATRKDPEAEEILVYGEPATGQSVDADRAWLLLHTEDEQALMASWGTSVHTADDHCLVQCIVHNPSTGPHRDLTPHWRGDKGIMERICAHGVGHPDPDQFHWLVIKGQYTRTIHGCDGCCGGWST